MKISIITAVLNNRRFLEESILSVTSQSYKEIEFIIVDGGSTDGSIDIIKKHENQISGWISEPDEGLYDAMNKGINMSSGDVIGFLNSDDIYNSNETIEKVMSVFTKTKSASCYGDMVYVSPDLKKVIRYWKTGEYSEKLINNGILLPHPGFFARKDLFDENGIFNKKFRISADYDLILRFMRSEDFSTVYIPEILVKMRTGGVSNKNLLNIFKANMECYNILKENGLKYPSMKIIKKIFLKLIQRLKVGK